MGEGRVDHVALRRVMAEYAATLVDGGYDVSEVLHQLADQCMAVLGVSGVAVCLRRPDGPLEVVTATDGRASRVENEQVQRGEGPGVDAFATGRPVAVADLWDDDRWPAHTELARGVGYRGGVDMPLPAARAPVGVLDLYDAVPRRWTDDELEVAALLADMAAGYVLMARSLADSQTLTRQLQHALDSRVVVEQAKGMLAARMAIDVDEAFERLRSHARANRQRVRDVSREVVEGRLVLDADGPTGR